MSICPIRMKAGTGIIQKKPRPLFMPNPVAEFNPLKFDVNESKIIQITVFDVSGKKVIDIPTKELQPGISKMELDLTGLNKGL